jgi:serine phosphatase RsbU (regulator of sigma subunit)
VAAALGALRASRKSGHNLEQARAGVRPQAPSPGVNRGHPHAYLVDVDGNLEELEGPIHPPLGTGEEQPTFAASERQLASDERLILVTDGITERRTENGGRFGIEGIRRAVADIDNTSDHLCSEDRE